MGVGGGGGQQIINFVGAAPMTSDKREVSYCLLYGFIMRALSLSLSLLLSEPYFEAF